MTFKLQRLVLLLIAAVLAAPAWAQQGALTVPRNLDQLTDRADVIVRGSVVSARVEKHPELYALDTVVVTLRVKQTLKGQAGDTFTFRQYIWDIRDRRNAAGYRKGQDMLLLMIAPSRYGLSSPVGLEQGRFRILRERSGREIAVNGRNNLRLFDGIGAAAAKQGIALTPKSRSLVAKHRQGPIELIELTAMIRTFGNGSH